VQTYLNQDFDELDKVEKTSKMNISHCTKKISLFLLI